jgi:hypothetical protein
MPLNRKNVLKATDAYSARISSFNIVSLIPLLIKTVCAKKHPQCTHMLKSSLPNKYKHGRVCEYADDAYRFCLCAHSPSI